MAGAETTGEVICRLAMSPAARASASPSLAQHRPTAPAAIWRFAISADLWVFACGRSAMPLARVKAAMDAMLRSSASRSTTRAGVARCAAPPGA